ncbi:TonB-dependent receptor [Phenylobacterium sp.]|uniref:TonB-dependent receptor n=1 Tax=Phenylobacterium sp. TaxID=1871053 RepID=UPI0025F081AA|nr:TonB-dependent receptor [Phenylobacterium sp.]
MTFGTGGRGRRAVWLASALAGALAVLPGVAAAQSEALQEVVVTAQKRSEKVTEVPLSVSVVQGEALANKGATSLTDFAAYVPGLSVSNNGAPGINGIVIRGLATSYNNSFNAPLVVTYIDDVPTGASAGGFGGARGGTYSLDLMPYDVGEIEVLRGPQGTLYGAAAMGGILKYTLKRPSLTDTEFRVGGDLAKVKASGGGDWGLRASANVPILQDKLALRASLYRKETAGYIDNIGIGKKDANASKTYGGRVSLLFAPTDKLDIEATALIQSIRTDDNTAVNLFASNNEPVYGRYTRSTNYAEAYKQDAQTFMLKVNWDLDFATLTSSTGYAEASNTLTLDLSGIAYVPSVPTAHIPYTFRTDLEKFTQEVRLTSPSGGKVDWMVGAFYTTEDPSEFDDFRAYTAAGAPLAPPNDILLLGVTPGSQNKYTEWALFANGTYKLTERLDFSAGIRYGENRSKGCDPGFIGIYGNGGLYQCQQRPWDGVTTWMVNARYRFMPDSMIYARVATGYRPGGGCDTCGNPLLGVPATYKPDRLTNYELGVKGLLLDRRLQFDVAAFYIAWDDIQLRVTNANGFSYPGNGETAVSKGIEASAAYALDNGLRIGGYVTYTDAKLTADATGVGGRDGDRLPFSSKWAAALTADYSRELSGAITLLAGAGYHYKDGVVSQFRGTGQPFPIASQSVVDAYAGLDFGRTQARLYVKNLFNERAYTGLTFLTDRTRPLFIPIQPVTVGLSIDHTF